MRQAMARPNLAVVRRTAEWLEVLGDATPDIVLMLREDGEIVFCSMAVQRCLGLQPKQVCGRRLRDRVHPDDHANLDAAVSSWMAGEKDVRVAEIRMMDADGDWLPMEASGRDHSNNPAVGGLVIIVRDVSHRDESSWSLDESHARLVRAARGGSDALWDWDLEADEVHYSERWRELFGLGHADVLPGPTTWLDRIHPEDQSAFQTLLQAHIDGHTEALDHEHRVKGADGRYRWVLVRGLAARDASGKAIRIAGSTIDVSERKLFDPLTRLANRTTFKDTVQHQVDQWHEDPEHLFAVLFLDLDRFKVVNDSLGHSTGDRLLISVARRLETFLRPGDMVARLGGDEFAILLDNLEDSDHAELMASRIQELLSRPIHVGTTEVYSTASVGIALSSKGYSKAADIMRDADTALHRAKQSGRDRHEMFETVMHLETLNHFRLEVDLRRALRRDEFEVHYQPLIDLDTGKLEGFEALCRWVHPERGFVSPMEFIPLAEEVGLIAPIDRFVLGQAAAQARNWQLGHQHSADLAISVNVSSKQFARDDLVAHVERVLEESELDPRSLKLEITESAIMDNPDRAEEILWDLRELGVRLALDDFGTGYSSLGHLHRFPFDVVKIDRSFVSRLGVEEAAWSGRPKQLRRGHRRTRNPEIVRTIVALAKSLEMDVVAEGVETALHLELLRELGCKYGQGWYFAKPLPTDDVERLLVADPSW